MCKKLSYDESVEYGYRLGSACGAIMEAYNRAGKEWYTDGLNESMYRNPLVGFTELNKKAMSDKVLNNTDKEIIAYYIGNIPTEWVGCDLNLEGARSSFYIGMWKTKTMTVAEAADYLGVTPAMVSKLVSQGRLKSIGLGTKPMVLEGSVTAYARERKTARKS